VRPSWPILAELRRRGFGSLGAVRFQGPDDIDVALEVPVDADTVQYVRGIDMATGLPVYIDASTLVGGGGGGLNYQGTWNATTNSPAIPAADPSNNGWYYYVAAAGTTSIDGIAEWAVGDWIISNGAAWQKIDNSDIVTSVFGRVGTVAAVAGDYPETKGGTGQTAYVLGDVLYANATNTLARLAGVTASTRKFLRSLGAAGVATAPAWDTLVSSDLPTDAALAGNPTTTTQASSDDSTRIATTGFVQALFTALRAGVSSAFDTLAEIATELGLKAPYDADYLVKTANAGLSAERAVTDTTTVTWDWGTGGQAKAQIPNDVPLPGNPTTTTQAGTDNSTKLATTAQVQAAIAKQPEVLIIAIGDETTAIVAGVAKVTFRMPFAMTLTAVRASLTTASSSGLPTFDINESGSTILSTKLTIDSGELTSTTAATPAVISDTSLADDASITIDIDTAGTGATGPKIYLIGTRT
jgi:hypothetical protein